MEIKYGINYPEWGSMLEFVLFTVQMTRLKNSTQNVGAHTSIEHDKDTIQLKRAHIVLFSKMGAQVTDGFIMELITVIQHEHTHLIIDSEFDGMDYEEKINHQKKLDRLAYTILDSEIVYGWQVKLKYMGII